MRTLAARAVLACKCPNKRTIGESRERRTRTKKISRLLNCATGAPGGILASFCCQRIVHHVRENAFCAAHDTKKLGAISKLHAPSIAYLKHGMQDDPLAWPPVQPFSGQARHRVVARPPGAPVARIPKFSAGSRAPKAVSCPESRLNPKARYPDGRNK